ncbi:MAG TPA: hypothetical protein VGD74_00420 [Vulgatibacter sp.]
MTTNRVACLGVLALMALGGAKLSCGGGGDGRTGLGVGAASVTNPPPRPFGQQRIEVFHPTFVGWSFGGSFACDRNGEPVMVQIWDGVVDPCTETPPEGSRVMMVETSTIDPGPVSFGETCTGPRSAGAFFGIVQGGVLFVQRAPLGSVSFLGLDEDDVLEGTFSAQFSEGFGATTGGFRAEVSCVQFPFVLPVGGTGGTLPPGATVPPGVTQPPTGGQPTGGQPPGGTNGGTTGGTSGGVPPPPAGGGAPTGTAGNF